MAALRAQRRPDEMKKAMMLVVLTLVAAAFAMPARAEFELRTEEWTPPRLIDGIWVTSGISDEEAAEIAAHENVGQTEEQIRDGEWDAHWKAYWRELDAPEWAKERGQALYPVVEKKRRKLWQPQPYYSGQQQAWGWGSYGYWQQPETTLGEELLGASNDFMWGWQQGTQAASQHMGLPGYSGGRGFGGVSAGGSGGGSPRCGAPTKTTGRPCRNPVKGGGRCHLHR